MLKAKITKLSIIALVAVFYFCPLGAYIDLAGLSMTLHSLTHRADDLGLLKEVSTYPINPHLSDSLNQIIGSLETKKIISDKQGQSKVSEAIDYLLKLFIDGEYKIDKDRNTISFNYLGFTLNSDIEKFSNELLLIATLADYISTKYKSKEPVRILSNSFTSPILYSFLNSMFIQMFIQKNRNPNLTIVGGISEEDFELLKKRSPKEMPLSKNIKHYASIRALTSEIGKKPKMDVYLLNPNIKIDHHDNNIAKCEKMIGNNLVRIKILPKAFDNNFLTYSFVDIDQQIRLNELTNFFKDLIKTTAQGPAGLKNEKIYGFNCTKFEPNAEKMLTNLIDETTNKSKCKLFLFANNKVVECNLAKEYLTDKINLYGYLTKVITNLNGNNLSNLNAELPNNIRFYKYDKTHHTFKKHRSINSITVKATNLTDKL